MVCTSKLNMYLRQAFGRLGSSPTRPAYRTRHHARVAAEPGRRMVVPCYNINHNDPSQSTIGAWSFTEYPT
jgi:hypothetical protein